jgi:hypothetical protein
MPVIGAHTIVHGLLTIVLALAYAAVVVFLAQFPSVLGGGSGLAVAIATLIVAAGPIARRHGSPVPDHRAPRSRRQPLAHATTGPPP